jgi:signal transduction histidine kinase
MFKELKTRLTLLNLAVAGIILVVIAAMAYVMISSSIKDQSMQSFQIVLNNVATMQTENKPYAISLAMRNEKGLLGAAFPYYVFSIDSNGQIPADLNLPLPPDTVTLIIQKVVNNKDAIENKLSFETGGSIQKPASASLNTTKTSDTANLGSYGVATKTFSITVSDDAIKSKDTSYRYAAVYGEDNIQVVLQNLDEQNTLLMNVGIIFTICVAGGMLLLALGGRFLAERSIRPIRASWQKQREFVADASHELRTPLAAIISNIDVILDDPNSTVREKQLYCEGITQESKRMTQLVDGLLLLARADSDALMFQMKPVELAAVAHDAVTFMQPEAAKKEIGVSLQVNETVVVAGDPDRLKQVLLQLLDNAVKYTQNGGSVEVCVGRARDNAVIQVRDNGIGISKEDQKKIFERFFRADISRDHEVGGHGLGLSIAKYIVEQHGGSISVASRAGQGSIFTVKLPAAKEIDS